MVATIIPASKNGDFKPHRSLAEAINRQDHRAWMKHRNDPIIPSFFCLGDDEQHNYLLGVAEQADNDVCEESEFTRMPTGVIERLWKRFLQPALAADLSIEALTCLARGVGTTRNGALVTRRLSDVAPEEVRWLWDKRIVLGKLNILHGDPGKGKTILALYICARVTTGTPFCDGAACERGEVLFVTAEDGIADTIRPRLDSLGADASRVHVLDLVSIDRQGKTVEEHLDIGKHIEYLDHWLSEHPDAKMIVLDPLAAFLGKINSNCNSEVRGVLGRIARLAERRQVAILAIDHLTKNTEKAALGGIGSIAFTAAPRAVWQLRSDPDDPDRRLLLPVKMNLAKVDGLAFRLDGCQPIWEESAIRLSLDDVAGPASETPRQEAREWLKSVLKGGPVSAREIAAKAQEDGICSRTLRYAKKELGVVSKRVGGSTGKWSWMTPKQVEQIARWAEGFRAKKVAS